MTSGQHLPSARAILAGIVGIVFLSTAAHATDMPAAPAPDEWAAWSRNFESELSSCIQSNATACLARAFASRERPAAVGNPPDVVDDLYRDLRTAEAMTHDKDARDLLWRDFGIDASAYLGTGYSVALAGAGARDYEYAVQREFFVPNLCAEAVDPAVCPKRDAGVWTWRLSAAEAVQWLDKPIALLLRKHRPGAGAAGFARPATHAAHAAATALPPLLIRFGSLSMAYYKGTFGRPGAQRVFFADYGQVRGKTLRAAMTATGASTLLDNPDPAKTFFIWVYAPDANSQASVASWRALFAILARPAR